VCFFVTKRGKDGFDDAAGIPKDVVVPEPNDSKTLDLEPSGALRIASALSRMLTTIDFNDELAFKADEIDDEPSDGRLTPEEASIELTVTQP